MLKFETASDAFHDMYWRIVRDGVDFAETKALFNVGFEIVHAASNTIFNSRVDRNWSIEYAEAEWQWYLSGNRSIYKSATVIELIDNYTRIYLIIIL